MNLKTSFFNKTIFGSDFKRYWWISALEALLFVIASVIPLYNECFMAHEQLRETIFGWTDSGAIISMIFSFGTAVLIESYMHSQNSVSMHHSLPLKRHTLYITKLVSGLFIFTLPMLLTAGIITALSLDPVCKDYIVLSDIGRWLYTSFAYAIVIFSLTTLVNNMTGSPVGTVVFTVGFGFLPLWITVILDSVFSHEILGFSSDNMEQLMEYIYIGPHGITKREYCLVYPVMSVVFLSLGYVLYRIRKSERYGEVIAFSWLKPLFTGIIAVLASGIGYSYVLSVFDIQNLFSIIPFGILGTAIAYMISVKSLNFKGCIRPVLVYTSLALVFVAFIHFDLTGFEKRIPKTDNIKAVYITSGSNDTNPMFKEKEHIELVRDLHAQLIQNSDTEYGKHSRNMTIEYTLKNGRKLTRRYIYDIYRDREYVKPLFETKEYRESYFDIANTHLSEITAITMYDRRMSKELRLNQGDELFDTMINSVRKDMIAYTYEEFTGIEASSFNVNIFSEKKDANETRYRYRDIYFNVTEKSVNTLNALEIVNKLGGIPRSEDIASLNVNICKAFDGSTVMQYDVTDHEEIADIYALYDSMLSGETFTEYDTGINVYLSYTLKNGHQFQVSCTYDKDKLPDVFKVK